MKSVKSIHKAALTWYSQHARAFPWRPERDPYRVLLSEMMSQQTQISRVVGFYERWLEVFPTVTALASASKVDVLREWSGLGYNSRALRLHSLAKIVVAEHKGKMPRTVEALLELPGVGMYTAHALVCSAYRKAVPVVDVNIRRIFSRLFFEVAAPDEMQPESESWAIAARVLPEDEAYRWNQALMDIGALFCTARSPKCDRCPLHTMCMSACSPVFQTPAKKKKSNEPAFNGIPRRLFRGKILKLLHAGPMSEDDIAQRLWNDFGEEEAAWLSHVLGQMEKNELISRRGRKISIAA
jgi:A/G-specific adenine glycosylase